ncbi:MAG: hypothetical protein U0270_20860 [Labilithrix sp.]
MASRDLLDIAADAAERLEREGGLVACGRRVDGVTRVDFWSGRGQQHSLILTEAMTNVDEIVLACLVKAGVSTKVDPYAMKH